MGVRGLASFLKDNRQSLCQSVHLTQDDTGATGPTPVVVDAWGIIYQLYFDSLPWASGGEYLAFHRIVKKLIGSWRKVGLEPTFVFDGASPPEKHQTILDRLQQQVKTSLLFHTTSIQSRSSPSFSRGSVILPPFTSQTFIHALHALHVTTHFVPTGEADGVCVALAHQLGGYVLGNDSDFLILISSPAATRVKGYCPLDMMMWIEGKHGHDSTDTDEASISSSSRGADQWCTAGPRKTAPIRRRQTSLLPPKSTKSPTLVLTSISPSSLRHRLRLPASHLPLLASLVGNDYIPLTSVDTFFEAGLTVVQRIEKVARVLREQIFGPSSSRLANAGDQAVELVRRVVSKLSVRGFLSEAVLFEMVDTIIEATFHYVLPGIDECCVEFPFCGELDGICRTVIPFTSENGLEEADTSREGTDNADARRRSAKGKSKFAAAQRRGLVSNVTHAYLYPDRGYLWTILEDPTGPSLRTSERSREIRIRAWSIMEATLGGMRWPEPTEEEKQAMREDRALQDLLGVVSLGDGGKGDGEEEGEGSSPRSEDLTLVDVNQKKELELQLEELEENLSSLPRSRTMVEYTRQGSSNRITATRIPLPQPILETSPTLLPLQSRVRLYLEILSSKTPLIEALPPHLHPLLAITRLCILEMAARSHQSRTKSDSKLRRQELVAILKAGLGMHATWRKDTSHNGKPKRDKTPDVETDEGSWPSLTARNSCIIAQINAIAVDSMLLAQSLLLLPEEDGEEREEREESRSNSATSDGLTHLMPFMFISGVAIHSLLQGEIPPSSTGWIWSEREEKLVGECLEAVVEGIEGDVVGWTPASEKGKTTAGGREATSNKVVEAVVEVEVQKSRRRGKKSGPRVQVGKGGSRFDLLEGLTS